MNVTNLGGDSRAEKGFPEQHRRTERKTTWQYTHSSQLRGEIVGDFRLSHCRRRTGSQVNQAVLCLVWCLLRKRKEDGGEFLKPRYPDPSVLAH